MDKWLSTPTEDLDVDSVSEILSTVADDVWVSAACVDALVDAVDVQRAIISFGLERTRDAVDAARKFRATPSNDSSDDGHGSDSSPTSPAQHTVDPHRISQLLAFRSTLLHRLDLLETYSILTAHPKWLTEPDIETPELSTTTESDPWDEDPWDAQNALGEPSNTKPSTQPPLLLSQFLTSHIIHSTLFFASTNRVDSVRIVWSRHPNQIFPYRFSILEAIPEYSHPSSFRDLLPSIDFNTDIEVPPTLRSEGVRDTPDWVETTEGCAYISRFGAPEEYDSVFPPSPTLEAKSPLPGDELSIWYRTRIQHIDVEAGLVDIALAYVQYGAAQNVPGLDLLGEDLSLLARLVYDAPEPEPKPSSSSSPIPISTPSDWSLSQWTSTPVSSIIQAYLHNSTPLTIASDIKRLVMPYLFVLESRAERSGTPNPTLATDTLHSYILNAPLDLVAAIVDASKPTLPTAQRLIKNDEEITRLALACLYGSDSLNEWSTMTRIFECLPDWQGAAGESLDDGTEVDMTLLSLAEFLKPSATRPKCKPEDLLMFFTPLPASGLSRALDILDEHLGWGETFSRWGVPAPLRWFVQSAEDVAQQRAWAIRMARQSGGARGGDMDMEAEEDWQQLLDEMLSMTSSGDVGRLKGAFGLIPRAEIVKIFFSGLLSTAKFDLGRNLLNPPHGNSPLSLEVIEDLVLATSREFYDNASSGNLHHGDMKLAFECLSVASSSPRIRSERAFIEATSRLSTYNLRSLSNPTHPLTPLEIRLVKDRLTLVERVLTTNEHAYKHSEVILDLANKLGYRGDVRAEVKVLGMLADSAVQSEDWEVAAGLCERMVAATEKLTESSTSKSKPRSPTNVAVDPADEKEKTEEACRICWQMCYQLGRQPEFPDVKTKLALLGHALRLCPSDITLDILGAWRKVEAEDLDSMKTLDKKIEKPRRKRDMLAAAGGSLYERLNSPRLVSATTEDAAALAKRTLQSVASNFPFSVRGRLQGHFGSGDDNKSDAASARSLSPDAVSSQARQALARGVGWLIGANDDEL